MINWRVRIRNRNFWLSIIPAVILLIQAIGAVFGVTWDFGDLSQKLIAVVNAVFVVLAILGIVTDHTTEGIGDSNRAMTIALVQLLQKLNIDLVVLAGCMVIFTEELVSAYPNAVMNVHPALIPSFCGEGFYGLKVHEAALSYGVKLSGATVGVYLMNARAKGSPVRLA